MAERGMPLKRSSQMFVCLAKVQVELCWPHRIINPLSPVVSDKLFPIDISCVEKDHDFLDRDSICSLFRYVPVPVPAFSP